MQRFRKIFLLTAVLALLSAVEGRSFDPHCSLVHGYPCSPTLSTKNCTVKKTITLTCYCFSGAWMCPICDPYDPDWGCV